MKITKVIEQAKAGFWGVDSGRLRPPSKMGIFSHTGRSPWDLLCAKGLNPFGNPSKRGNKLPLFYLPNPI